MKNIKISNGTLVDPSNKIHRRGDLYIAEGKIINSTKKPSDFTIHQDIDATNMIVCPGLIDSHCYLKKLTPSTIRMLSKAAFAGGVTSIACSVNNDSTFDNVEEITYLESLTNQHTLNIAPITSATVKGQGKHLTEFLNFKSLGCEFVGNYSSNFIDNKILNSIYQYAKMAELTMFILPLDFDLAKKSYLHEGNVSTRLGLEGIPKLAETLEIQRHLSFIKEYDVRAHFSQITTSEGVLLLQQAKQQGINISADISIQHLHLTDIDCADLNPHCYLIPPLREYSDLQVLRQLLQTESSFFICGGHHDVSLSDKMAPFSDTSPGCNSFQLLLPMSLRLIKELDLTLDQIISLITDKPAKNLNQKIGQFTVGYPADVCIFDLNESWIVNQDSLNEGNLSTPFLNWECIGRVHYTLKNGNIVYQKQ